MWSSRQANINPHRLGKSKRCGSTRLRLMWPWGFRTADASCGIRHAPLHWLTMRVTTTISASRAAESRRKATTFASPCPRGASTSTGLPTLSRAARPIRLATSSPRSRPARSCRSTTPSSTSIPPSPSLRASASAPSATASAATLTPPCPPVAARSRTSPAPQSGLHRQRRRHSAHCARRLGPAQLHRPGHALGRPVLLFLL
jgi:hypothetical protein